jgi:hypothetical protein
MADFGTEVLGVLSSVAPSIASALGGPLAGAGVSAIIGALGLAPDTPPGKVAEAVSLAAANPDQLLALKRADQAFAAQMKQLDVDFAKLSSSDIANARARETAVHDRTPAVLAYSLTLGFFGMLSLMIFHVLPAENGAAVNILLGALGTGWIQSINYYYGSTYGSKTKDAMLFQSVPASSVAASVPAQPAGRVRSPGAGPDFASPDGDARYVAG